MIKIEVEKVYYFKEEDVREEYDDYVEMCKEDGEKPNPFEKWVEDYFEDIDLDYDSDEIDTKKFKITIN